MNSDRPGIKGSLEKKRIKTMFQGTTIDELIRTVERAEQSARQREEKSAAEINLQSFPVYKMNWRAATEVA
jgi:hypothetical protein